MKLECRSKDDGLWQREKLHERKKSYICKEKLTLVCSLPTTLNPLPHRHLPKSISNHLSPLHLITVFIRCL